VSPLFSCSLAAARLVLGSA